MRPDQSRINAWVPHPILPNLLPLLLGRKSASRPADVSSLTVIGVARLPWDVTMISTLQDLTVAGAAASPGHALRVESWLPTSPTGISFVPLVVETLGGWCEEATLTIGRLLGQRFGISPAESTRHLFQRLSVCLWRGNANCWLDRMPSHSAWVDGVV